MDDRDTDSGKIRDRSAYDNHGTINGASSGQAGIVGQSFDFDGSSDYVDTGNFNPYLFDAVTITSWIKNSNVSDYEQIYGSRSGGQNNFRFLPNSELNFGFYDGSVNGVSSSNTYDDGNWHHMVGTWDVNSGLKLYVDGLLVDSSSDTTFRGTSTNPNIGREAGTNRDYFGGKISSLRVYDRVLSESEIQRLYNKRSATPGAKITNFVPDITNITKKNNNTLGNRNEGIAVSKNGEYVFLSCEGPEEIRSYKLSSPYDITSASQVGTHNVGNTEGSHIEMGGNSFIYGRDNDGVAKQIVLSNSFDINNVNKTNELDCSSEIGTAQQAVSMSYNGTRFYTIGRSSATLAQYKLSTPYDISTGTVENTFNIESLYNFESNNLAGMDFSTTGNFCVICEGSGSSKVRLFQLSTPYDFSTATKIYEINNPEGDNIRGLSFTDDFLYLTDFNSNENSQYKFYSY